MKVVSLDVKELKSQVLLKSRILCLPLLIISLWGISIPTCNWVQAQESESKVEHKDALKLFREFVEATEKNHRKDSKDLYVALVRLNEMSKVALPLLLDGASHENDKVRERCHYALWKDFATEPAAINLFIRSLKEAGSSDFTNKIRYRCVFNMGTHKIKRAAEVLRHIYENDKDLRLTAAKSLAELGYTDGFLTLYDNLGSDRYMPRYQANIGIKALTGKDLNNFAGYSWREHAHVSGGHEIILSGRSRSIGMAEDKANRYRAIVDFRKWLNKEKPKLAVLLDYSPIIPEKLKAYKEFRKQNKPKIKKHITSVKPR